jgi:hypothetical protein
MQGNCILLLSAQKGSSELEKNWPQHTEGAMRGMSNLTGEMSVQLECSASAFCYELLKNVLSHTKKCAFTRGLK